MDSASLDPISHLGQISESLQNVKSQCETFLKRPKHQKGPDGAVKTVKSVLDASTRQLSSLDTLAHKTPENAKVSPDKKKAANPPPAEPPHGTGHSSTPTISNDAPAASSNGKHNATSVPERFMTKGLFSSLELSGPTNEALRNVFGYSSMTAVQEAALPIALTGADVLAKAKTGTGKTLAFLIPVVEHLCKLPERKGVGCLVVAPTRELAQQICDEALKLTSTRKGFNVVCVVGGTNIGGDRNRLKAGADIVVATPGRCKDHLESTPGFKEKFLHNAPGIGLSVLVLDEADRMLDMGFQPDIKAILSYLPSARQTLLFSATVPEQLHEVVHLAFTQKSHQFVNCVGDDNEVHEHVEQNWIVVPMEDQLSTVARYIGCQMKVPNYKIMVFFATARHCGFVADLFEAAGVKGVLQIHSRMSQSKRTKVADQFRTSSGGLVLFSSDVSARGVDYPGVTAVLQVGQTSREQYIHRLGRTARAGASGKGMLILAPFEKKVQRSLSDMLPEKPLESRIDFAEGAAVERQVNNTIASLERNPELKDSASKAYIAWLGLYNSSSKITGWSKEELVRQAANFAKLIGLSETPSIQAKTIGKMGLKGTPGLKVEKGPSGRGGRGGRGGGRGGGGDR